MAQLKDTLVTGNLRATDSLLGVTGQFNILNLPTTSNGSTYGPGTSGHIVYSNGISTYWGATTGITSLGTVTTGTWSATKIAVNKGGTNIDSYSVGDILYASGATTLSKLGIGTAGYTLQATANGPAWTQTVAVANGGTGKTSWTQWGVLYASASTTLANTGAGTAGYLLQSNATSAPSWIQATNSNTASTIVKRDASGNFSAGTITASLTGDCSGSSGSCTGNSATATQLKDTRTIWGQNFNGTANVTGNLTDVGESIKAISGTTAISFFTSTSGALNAKLGRLGLNSTYANIDLTNYYLDVGGNSRFSGDGIYYKGTNATKRMIRWVDGTDEYGNGISIGGGGLTVLGAGESADTMISNLSLTGGTETAYIGSDGSIIFYPGINSWDAAAKIEMTAGKIWAGVDGNTTRENQIGVQSGAGKIYLYAQAAASGARGLYIPAHGTGDAKAIVSVDTNNNITLTGSLSGNASTATALKDKTNGTASYLDYGRTGITAGSGYTWVGVWDGYTLAPASKLAIAEGVFGALSVTTASKSGSGITVSCAKFGRVVQLHINGTTSAAVAAETTVVTLDAKYRPSQGYWYPAFNNTDKTFNRVRVSASGAIDFNVAIAKSKHVYANITYIANTFN